MISLELAQKLRATRINPSRFKTCDNATPMYYNYPLDQLLAGIRAAGYEYCLDYAEVSGLCDHHCIISKKGTGVKQGWGAGTPEDAAASALLWIMEQKGVLSI